MGSMATERKPAAARKAAEAKEAGPRAMTPAEALAAATERARVWATPVKQEAAAEKSKGE